MDEKQHHDVIIIGAGAAGLSAGLVLTRARADVLLIDAGQPRNAPAEHMHGFVSRDGMPPLDFLAAGRAEIASYGGRFLAASVVAIERSADASFGVTFADGTAQTCRAILVATGLVDELPDIRGVAERWGTLVHHCPYCHGHEVREQKIAVIGGPQREMSLKQAGLIRRYSDSVTLITNGIDLTPAELIRLTAFGVAVEHGFVSGLTGAPGSLDAIELTDGSAVTSDAAFIAPRQAPRDALLRSLGCQTDPATGLVGADGSGQTSVPGVWAAGNVVTPTAQVITAAGAGSATAIVINGWLLQQDLDAASVARPQ
ncbi:NAD(P)/FAD-dependent oxidoreductase [Micromonospora sp. DT81.3]|uniref:NAD(P)/FAD-dependent oxidoreductase n=1 Tax=Micromonospora sp. DT81.3 TaxID=3416523 RepID=UPI003CE8C13B